MSETILRPFAWRDIPAITGIYRHYVETSVVTFDTEAPSEAKMATKFGAMLAQGHPVIVAQQDDKVLGYAYASTYRPRPAYRFTCEDSLYLHPDAVGKGLGGTMLAELIAQSQAYGFKQMIAVITAGTQSSIRLHEKFGFSHIGLHTGLGLKFDQWLDIVHMQRSL
ncbi:GNAT family N-acetyltransferase [Devosia rhodophyticola]|uniref:GNAT family N-acetyltransferase n=1 Tax=Devosia rhodophyticola TaxID=3026423 RepID=A0ABY7YSQ0_9HYPH|nr:GNAT family N-acetyltransferase [Devosia rhodophyticola]WDR04401.1 GNAT family N-acetyltransferase [Devosia rhodophyticola]